MPNHIRWTSLNLITCYNDSSIANKNKIPIFRYFTFLIVNNILVEYSTAAGALGHVVRTVIHTSPCFGLVFPVSSKYVRLIYKPNPFLRATMAVIACTLVVSVLTLRIVQFGLETTLMGIQLQNTIAMIKMTYKPVKYILHHIFCKLL